MQRIVRCTPQKTKVGWAGFSAHAVTRLDVTASFKRIFFTRNSLHNGLVHIVRLYRVGKKTCPPYPAEINFCDMRFIAQRVDAYYSFVPRGQ